MIETPCLLLRFDYSMLKRATVQGRKCPEMKKIGRCPPFRRFSRKRRDGGKGQFRARRKRNGRARGETRNRRVAGLLRALDRHRSRPAGTAVAGANGKPVRRRLREQRDLLPQAPGSGSSTRPFRKPPGPNRGAKPAHPSTARTSRLRTGTSGRAAECAASGPRKDGGSCYWLNNWRLQR